LDRTVKKVINVNSVMILAVEVEILVPWVVAVAILWVLVEVVLEDHLVLKFVNLVLIVEKIKLDNVLSFMMEAKCLLVAVVVKVDKVETHAIIVDKLAIFLTTVLKNFKEEDKCLRVVEEEILALFVDNLVTFLTIVLKNKEEDKCLRVVEEEILVIIVDK